MGGIAWKEMELIDNSDAFMVLIELTKINSAGEFLIVEESVTCNLNKRRYNEAKLNRIFNFRKR